MSEMKIETTSIAAVNDQLKAVERELLSTDQRKHVDGIRRLHACIENLTRMILHSVEKVKIAEKRICKCGHTENQHYTKGYRGACMVDDCDCRDFDLKPSPEICVCGHERYKDHYPSSASGTLPCEICDCKDFKLVQFHSVQGQTARDVYPECVQCGRRDKCGARLPPWRKRRPKHCQGFAPAPASGQPECDYCAGTGEESPTKKADVPLVSCHVCHGTGRQPAPQNPIKLGSDEMFAEMDRIVAEVEQQSRGCDNCFESLKGPCGLPDCGPPEYPRWCKRYPREQPCPVCGHNQHEGRCGVMDDGIHPCPCNQPAPQQQSRSQLERDFEAVDEYLNGNRSLIDVVIPPDEQQREGGE